ncbi:MAG: hypothetical protein HY791_14765 [Deltaproteobacteria bacterium]|nr:hypothetical protein [Deltaproteobacteria bacterium]
MSPGLAPTNEGDPRFSRPELPPGAVAVVLHRVKSAFQNILLMKEADGTVVLTLDGYWQFHSDDEHVYHEVLADTPMVLAPKTEKVLILGGGDGLALRNILRYPVDEAVLCELDPEVLRLTRETEEMQILSGRSLEDPRTRVIVDDARRFLAETDEKFDVVISDFPASTKPELDVLFSHAFFRTLSRVTHPQSVVSIQVSQGPKTFWDIYGSVAQVFPNAMPLLVEMGLGDFGEEYWANFILASNAPTLPRRSVAAGARFLTVEKLPRLVVRNLDFDWFDTEEYPVGLLARKRRRTATTPEPR